MSDEKKPAAPYGEGCVMLCKALATRPKLLALLEKAKGRRMSPQEIREQKISFIYGQMMDCAPHVTKEQIAARLDEREGR